LALLALWAAGSAASGAEVLDSAKIRDALTGKGTSFRALSAAPRRVALQIQFEVGSTALAPDASQQLDQLWIALADPALRSRHVEISGHTDASGDADLNLILSERRAAAVRDYLVRKGSPVDAALLAAKGYGESQPLPAVDPNDPVHRRVEIRVVDAATAPTENP